VNQPLPNAEEIDVVELRIPRKAEWVALARLSVAAFASRVNFSLDEIEEIKLAVAEACTNAIQHAGSAFIAIRLESIDGLLRVSVSDYGEIVDGIGVFLIRSLMDEVEYQPHPDGGTILVMCKRLEK
jgi:serine/threonine-protein kinase RsbW